VRAPLNSRVSSTNGLPKSVKGKGKEEPLDHMPIDIQEAMILEDLLNVLMVRGDCSILYSISFDQFAAHPRVSKAHTSRSIQTTHQKMMIRCKESNLSSLLR
jgi:hypothetical protein